MAGDETATYPQSVLYCGECTMPIEYCEYWPNYDRCREWLANHLPDEFDKLDMGGAEGEEGEEGKEKKRQTRGGRGVIKAKKKAQVERKIIISITSRSKRKYVTNIKGLGTCGIDLKKAAKFFGTKLATGASVTGEGDIVIQGDVQSQVIEMILETWPDIDESVIEEL